MAKKVISPSAITMDGSTQMRARMDDEYIDELAEVYQGDHEIPPPTVFWDGTTYWLGDGHNRVMAAIKAELKGLEVVVINGTQRDAVIFACSANDTHGLRRTAADKRKAVKTLLEDKLWRTRSDRFIGQTCRVSHTLVASIREQLNSTGGNSSSETRTGSDGKKRGGKKKAGESAKDDDKPKPGQELFDFAAYFSHLNAMRRAPDHMYRAHGKQRKDGAIDRDPAYDALSRALEAFHAAFEARWAELAKQPFPKQ